MGVHLKNKNHSHACCGWRKKVLQTENLRACITGQIVKLWLRVSCGNLPQQVSVSSLFSTWLYSSSTKSLCTLNILPATQAKNGPFPSLKIQMLHP